MNGQSGQTPSAPAGWYADPLGRHERRYWDGAAWTDHIVDGTTQGMDPVSAPPRATQQAAQVAPYGVPGAMPTPPRAGRSANRVAGCVVAAAGGAAMIAGTYMTWLSAGGAGFSGWRFYQMESDVQQNVFWIGHMFTGTSPFLTGLSTLIIGIALIVLALLAVALPASPSAAGRAGKWEVNSGLVILVIVLAVCVLVGGVWNMASWLTTGRDSNTSAGAGLYFVAAGGIAGFMGLVRAIAHRMVA